MSALPRSLAAGWFGTDWFFTGRFMVTTDDAYIGGDIATISSKLSGYVATVNVVANQTVKAGDPLITLDDGDYRIARDQALAQIDTQNLTLKRIDAQVTGAEAVAGPGQGAEAGARGGAEERCADPDARRGTAAKGASAPRPISTRPTRRSTRPMPTSSLATRRSPQPRPDIAVLKGQRAEAEGQLKTLGLARDKAERDLGFTVLRAPYDGVVGNLSVQTGDLVSAGTRLAALVPTTALYIDANFKETQLTQLVPGETVTIKVDALEGAPIIGTVESIAPASGSVFSLLPAENATGNFTKVVQRVPVRIALPADALATGKLRAGLSVMVEADTRTAPADQVASVE